MKVDLTVTSVNEVLNMCVTWVVLVSTTTHIPSLQKSVIAFMRRFTFKKKKKFTVHAKVYIFFLNFFFFTVHC